jgi:hypothetical protein
MIWSVSAFLRLTLIFGISVLLVTMAEDAWARGPGGGMRARPNVSRQGPARSGSFHSTQERGNAPRDERPGPDRSAKRDPGPDRRDARRANESERGPDRTRDLDRLDRRDDDRQEYRDDGNDRDDDRRGTPASRPVARERRDDRRDYYDDRRDFGRGARYNAAWWSSNSCSDAEVVHVDAYTYYRCEDAWFGRSYYGGEVVYTVIDAPEGY